MSILTIEYITSSDITTQSRLVSLIFAGECLRVLKQKRLIESGLAVGTIKGSALFDQLRAEGFTVKDELMKIAFIKLGVKEDDVEYVVSLSKQFVLRGN